MTFSPKDLLTLANLGEFYEPKAPLKRPKINPSEKVELWYQLWKHKGTPWKEFYQETPMQVWYWVCQLAKKENAEREREEDANTIDMSEYNR